MITNSYSYAVPVYAPQAVNYPYYVQQQYFIPQTPPQQPIYQYHVQSQPVEAQFSPQEVANPKTRTKAHNWTPSEDRRLIQAVEMVGTKNWSKIAQLVGNGRTRSQCSQRWSRCLDPQISREKWTKDEDKKLLQLVKIHGTRSWVKVAEQLEHRSDVQCRYHYKMLVRDLDDSTSEQEEPIKLKKLKTPPKDISKLEKMSLPPISEMFNVSSPNLLI